MGLKIDLTKRPYLVSYNSALEGLCIFAIAQKVLGYEIARGCKPHASEAILRIHAETENIYVEMRSDTTVLLRHDTCPRIPVLDFKQFIELALSVRSSY